MTPEEEQGLTPLTIHGVSTTFDIGRRDRWSWLAAVALFVAGDMVTTVGGLALGAVGSSPVALATIGALGLWPAMVLLKATVLSLVGPLWACSPQGYRAAAPITLGVWGAGVVANNSLVVVEVAA